jgi:hypothetical protein
VTSPSLTIFQGAGLPYPFGAFSMQFIVTCGSRGCFHEQPAQVGYMSPQWFVPCIETAPHLSHLYFFIEYFPTVFNL